MSTIRMYQILKKTNLNDEDAHLLVDELIAEVDRKFSDRKEHLATEDLANVRAELTKSIYIASITQILTILGGLFGILKLMQVI